MNRELKRDAEEIETVHRHPAGGVGLIEMGASGKCLVAIEYADIIQAQESSLEDVVAMYVLAIDPPGEVEEELVHDAFQERHVAGIAALFAVDLEDAPGSPRVNWW